MEIERGKILSKVLSQDELAKIPAKILKKLELHFEERFEEFITSKALCDTAKSTIGKLFTVKLIYLINFHYFYLFVFVNQIHLGLVQFSV